jgi:hypothetical protein
VSAAVPPRFRDGAPAPCTCPCHADPQIQHIQACCAPCPRCGARLAAGIDAHLDTCAGPAPAVR